MWFSKATTFWKIGFTGDQLYFNLYLFWKWDLGSQSESQVWCLTHTLSPLSKSCKGGPCKHNQGWRRCLILSQWLSVLPDRLAFTNPFSEMGPSLDMILKMVWCLLSIKKDIWMQSLGDYCSITFLKWVIASEWGVQRIMLFVEKKIGQGCSQVTNEQQTSQTILENISYA